MQDIVLEQVSRAVILAIKSSLPTKLNEVEAETAAEDAAFFAAMGISPVPSTLLPDPVLYDIGHFPRQLERPLEEYPVVTAMAYEHRSVPDRGSSDQVEGMGAATIVEAYVSSIDEATCNRVAWRYARALHRTIAENKTLNGLTLPVEQSPDVIVSLQNTRRRNLEPGLENDELAYVQGIRIDYVFVVPQLWDAA